MTGTSGQGATSVLALTARAAGDLCTVTLTNMGRAPVVVAGRLAIGYRDSTDREIYAVLSDPSSGREVGTAAQLYHRAPHPAGQLRTLAPDESISTTVRVADWYNHPAGELDLRVVYDPAAVASRFPRVADAVVVSEPIRVDLPMAGWT